MILCLMQLPPAADGHGGSQRAWNLVSALASRGPVHFVLLHAPGDERVSGVNLEPLRQYVASITKIDIKEWATANIAFPFIPGRVTPYVDLLRMGVQEAPRLSTGALKSIAARLPVREVDVIFAGRLGCATIADKLLHMQLIKARRRVVDFDDIMSRFRRREIKETGKKQWFVKRMLDGARLQHIERAENKLLASWDGVAVCSADDVEVLQKKGAGASIILVPNVVNLPPLTPLSNSLFRLLFVGNLSFQPNKHGLEEFLANAWPRIVATRPDVRLTVVGMNPPDGLVPQLKRLNVDLHANVPSVEPYYKEADAVIAPILFGGGTRIKIIEAMAYGRPVISTTIGAEGLMIVPGRHALIADTMPAFADAILQLADDADLQRTLIRNGKLLQETHFSKQAMSDGVDRMLHPA